MKPNAAAPVRSEVQNRVRNEVQTKTSVRPPILGSLALSALLFLASGSARALDGIDLSAPPEPVAEGECPRLIQIKYPFLTCRDGQIGIAEGDDTWQDSRRIPKGGAFTEGGGYWGPNLNYPYPDDI